MAIGVGIRHLSYLRGLHFEDVTHLVHIFGTAGLVMYDFQRLPSGI